MNESSIIDIAIHNDRDSNYILNLLLAVVWWNDDIKWSARQIHTISLHRIR